MKKGLIAFCLFSLIASPLISYADIDPAVIAFLKQIAGSDAGSLLQLKDLLKNAKDVKGIENSIEGDIKSNLQGNFGYGSLLNGDSDLSARQWSNDNWTDVLNDVNTSKTSSFYQAQQQYAKLYPAVDASQIGANTTPLTRNHYMQESQISRSALAASSYSYDQINAHLQNLHDLLAKLDAQPSEIAAQQINARLVAEVGFIQLEMLKQQTISNQILATQSQDEVNGMSDAAQFMK